MFQSYYRASDKYAVPVTSLAIYTGKTKPVNTYCREWEGTSVRFKFNAFSVDKADTEELKRDKRDFALAILTGKRMIEAKRAAAKRGAYSLELLDLIRERNWSEEKAWSFRRFAYRLLQIDKDDIDRKVKEVWKMEFVPISEVVREIHIRDAREFGREEGMEKGIEKGRELGREEGILEVARKMLARQMPIREIVDLTGLNEGEIQSIQR
jgi:predicted transposase/invertase (TIGR01784 family)